MANAATFKGFDKRLFKFFKDLKNNNNIDWFHDNKSKYLELLVEPAKSLVIELAPFLNQLNPAIRSEPKFNQTLMRINKDMRFAKGEPYRSYFLIHFGRFKMDSEFYIYLDGDCVQIGLFINNTNEPNLYFKQNLIKYRKQILDVCEKHKINNRFSLCTLKKDTELILKKFNAGKHIDRLENINYILLQKTPDPSWEKVFSDRLIVETVKMISTLYPLYCFAISPNPLKELQRFEDNFGQMMS